jgi:hypothetical protein
MAISIQFIGIDYKKTVDIHNALQSQMSRKSTQLFQNATHVLQYATP